MKIAFLHVALSASILTMGQSSFCMGQSSTPVKKHPTVTRHPAAKTATKTTAKTATPARARTKSKAGTVAAKRAPVLPPTGSAVSPVEAKAALDFHNAKRAEAGVPALQWSPQLATVAQAWADHLARDLQCKMQHTPNNPYGENLFGGGGKYTAMDAAQMWYSEKQKYSGGALTTGNYASAGHYTQMMWQATTQVGIGVGSCNGSLVIVAEYSPHGNVLGQKPY